MWSVAVKKENLSKRDEEEQTGRERERGTERDRERQKETERDRERKKKNHGSINLIFRRNDLYIEHIPRGSPVPLRSVFNLI